jgi:hypothetical protein
MIIIIQSCMRIYYSPATEPSTAAPDSSDWHFIAMWDGTKGLVEVKRGLLHAKRELHDYLNEGD